MGWARRNGHGAERPAELRERGIGRWLKARLRDRAGSGENAARVAAGVWRGCDIGRYLGKFSGVRGGRRSSGAAKGNFASGVVADVSLVVGVDDVLRWARELSEGREEAGPITRGGDIVDGESGDGGIVDGPAQRECALFVIEQRVQQRGRGVAVLRGEDVEGKVTAVFHLDLFGKVEDGMPGPVGRLKLFGVPGAAGVVSM